MISSLIRFAAWLMRRIAVYLLIAVLALAASATWLFLQDESDFESLRLRRLAELAAGRDVAARKVDSLTAEVATLQNEAGARQVRLDRERSVRETLTELDSRWERWFGNAEQQRLNDTQRERVKVLEKEDRTRLLELQRTLAQRAWELESAEQELAALERERARVEETRSALMHYFLSAWRELKAPLGFALLLLLFGPFLLRCALYFAAAPLVLRGRPIRFAEEIPSLPNEGQSRSSLAAAVWPGERLRVKRKYLQSTDGGVSQGARALLDWRKPLTSLLCGFVAMAELRNRQARGESEVGLAGRVGDELAVLQVPDGGSIVVKPRFLVGVIQQADQSLVMRMHWPLLSRQAWATGQLRFVEIFGPCRLVLAGSGGIRTEVLAPREGAERPLRRAERATLVAFTPNLELRYVRTQRVRDYLLGRRTLFEALFSGAGMYTVAQAPYRRGSGVISKAFFRVRNRVLDVLGL